MEKEYPEENELVLCTVETISNTSVFVKLDDYGKTGILVTSEIAPGRIRNIRDYVVLNKRIVCKVLRVDKERGHIDLSLRRVSAKEKKEAMENYKKEKDALSIFERVVEKTKVSETVLKIKNEFSLLSEFLSQAKENPTLFEKFNLGKEAEKLSELIKERIRAKKAIVKASIKLKLPENSGISSIKKIFDIKKPGIKITYISAPNYLISVETDDYKKSNRILSEVIAEIASNAKKAGGSADVQTQ